MIQRLTIFLIFVLPALIPVSAQTTNVTDSTEPHYRTVIAGKEYKKGGMHRWLWGSDYRKEWTTPVTLPVLNFDSAFGGLTPLKLETEDHIKILKLKDAGGKHYILRNVNKTYLGSLPQVVEGTFVETIANDQIATNHPYAALTVPVMAEAAGIYHTTPRYFYVPKDERLGIFNKDFAHTLSLLEEWPDHTHISAPAFGRAQDIVSSQEMMKMLLERSNHLIDQYAYLKARLFDMLIGDWSRKKENWRWSVFDSSGYKIYKPIPLDRDQTYAKFEGFLLSAIIPLGKFRELQTFEGDIDNIKWYNYPAYAIDKRFTNTLTKDSWTRAAEALKTEITDAVIESSVGQLPPEIFEISGKEIIKKLKSRRDKIGRYAEEYYEFLSRDVEIPGTKEAEIFEVRRLNNEESMVSVFSKSGSGSGRGTPHYVRTFLHSETKEIHLYGIGGRDVFRISGDVEKSIKVRISGGPEKDSLNDISSVGGWGRKTKYYDNPGNIISSSDETSVHLSRFPSVNHYEYQIFNYDSRGVKPVFYYNTFYRFYVGVGYSFTKNKTRDGDFSSKHSVGLNYSLIEKSFHPYYIGVLRELIGGWNFNINAGYDGVRRLNFFGRGNESVALSDDISYHWFRMKTIYGSVGIDQTFLNRHNIGFDLLYNGVKVIDHPGRYTSKAEGIVPSSDFNWKQFGGGQLTYSYLDINDRVVPTKGVSFQVAGAHTVNLKETGRRVSHFSASARIYKPLPGAFSLAIKSGGATLTGDPELYQLNQIGGFYTLRGFWRYRFYGNTTFYNQNELRWLPSVKGRLFSGRIGLMAFIDQGRVWDPGEDSNQWHYGYGGGVIMVPFNKMAIAVTYGRSNEGARTNIRLGRFF